MGKRPQGKCALCKKECELTFEHIPPRTAYNSRPIKSVFGDKIMKDTEHMPWKIAGLFIRINSKEWGNIVYKKM